MSMNIEICGKREITVNKTGAVEIQEWSRSAWQTPTEITYAILKSANPVEAYKEWVMTQSFELQDSVYAEDDIWREKEPIRFESYDPAKIECDSLTEWIAEITALGYVVELSDS